MLDKAQLSLDDKAKIKALLNLHIAIEFMSLEESEDNEEEANTIQQYNTLYLILSMFLAN